MAIDVGVGAVINRWELGFGANGIANRIDWTDAERITYFHANLLTGDGDLIESAAVPVGEVRVELPIDYRANVGYNLDRWSAIAEFGRGLQGKSFHGGAEFRLGAVDVRGGAVYSRELWNPSGGVGLNLSDGFGVDVAVYGNSANAERKRNPAIAVSLRFNR
jgi:hypothetical protein